jgi:ABC transporter substrate binding protein (PQQ-dependent alcohol dehydrogenase system)
VSAPDIRLRQEDCRANVLHTAPDLAMLADALAQYLVWKKWSRWLVAKGPFPEDQAYLEAILSNLGPASRRRHGRTSSQELASGA